MELSETDERIGVEIGEPPCPVKIVLSARPVNPWFWFPVNPDHFIAFVPAAPLVLKNGECYSYKLPIAPSFQKHVVPCPRNILPPGILARFAEVVAIEISLIPTFARSTLPVLGVKISCIRSEGWQLHPIDVPVKIRDIQSAFVGNSDPSLAGKGHGEVGIERFVGCHGNQC